MNGKQRRQVCQKVGKQSRRSCLMNDLADRGTKKVNKMAM